MRVIAGRLGGRQLLAPKGWKVRPTSERVREAIFSALGDIGGMRVADLYCGTGALGIEAISRGAGPAVLVDRETRPAMGNVHNLGLTGEAELVRAEAPEWIANVPDGSFDLVFLDPPYRDATRIAGELDPHLARILAPGGRVIAESDRRGPLEFPSLETVRERRYGRTVVTFHRVPSQPPQDPTGTE
ncbi:MAG TPA: RsmD family RNA methyltransferase [Solirubrobacterales bacterium]|jgi:16S rRNA (guanine966-N2)-methyltransferase|nr:RsmD family RNA methyltransferase [Solirubrobacterales bacterium]HMU26827.1 RsmD family RNA methyltransferase [Solirubrobacterales bacterium]HMW44728.1 RsmD family RNA methyltransferase [Solirubrobacterales bacterium]HMX71936.1 RsmD family RNA methyltransferase [Solirubrobacterales bacterium]HMY25305.1 RsmD family RNA methyltransferase [Solirubrobacterales bacterium]